MDDGRRSRRPRVGKARWACKSRIGEEMDGLIVRRFAQADATFTGLDLAPDPDRTIEAGVRFRFQVLLAGPGAARCVAA